MHIATATRMFSFSVMLESQGPGPFSYPILCGSMPGAWKTLIGLCGRKDRELNQTLGSGNSCNRMSGTFITRQPGCPLAALMKGTPTQKISMVVAKKLSPTAY
jgi:hypothetical protein